MQPLQNDKSFSASRRSRHSLTQPFTSDEANPDDDKSLLSATSQQRKSAAQLRRRQRKERRSTGLPELRNDAAPDVSDESDACSDQEISDVAHKNDIDRSNVDNACNRLVVDSNAAEAEYAVKPSGSPRPARSWRTRSRPASYQGSRSNKENVGVKTEKTVSGRRRVSNEDAEDEQYAAMVKRLKDRIKKTRPGDPASDQGLKPESVGVLTEMQVAQEPRKNQQLKQDISNPPKPLSFVDMFAKPSAQASHREEIDGLAQAKDSEENIDKKAGSSGESLPLLSLPEDKENIPIRRQIPSVKSGRKGERLDAALVPPNVYSSDPQVGTEANPTTEVSRWKRFLGIFSCFLIFCGVWKCFSK